MTEEEIQNLQTQLEAATTAAANAAKAAEDAIKERDSVKANNTDLLREKATWKEKAATTVTEQTSDYQSQIELLKTQFNEEKLARTAAEEARKAEKINNELLSNLAKAKAMDFAMQTLPSYFKSMNPVMGDDGIVRVGAKTMDEIIEDFKASDAGKHHFAAPANSGGGAGGNNGHATSQFTKETFTLTEFGKLAKTDASKANELAKNFGKTWRA